MRKTLIVSLAVTAALLAGGVALAQPAGAPGATRAQVEQRAAERFGRMDANHDGKLDRTDREARRAALFDRIDADGNGAISRDEFSARRREAGAGRGETGPRFGYRAMGPERMARAADADRDGTITAAEFATAALERFDRVDANKDGTITREERRAQRRERRGGDGLAS